MSAIREAFIRHDIWETEDKEEEKRLKEQIRISVQHSIRALNTPQEDTGASNYSNILLYIYIYIYNYIYIYIYTICMNVC